VYDETRVIIWVVREHTGQVTIVVFLALVRYVLYVLGYKIWQGLFIRWIAARLYLMGIVHGYVRGL
jgi:hypothetical protein